MRLYRVNVDTLNESYLYEVEADEQDDAREQARALAIADGLDPWRQTYVDVERLA